MHAPSLFVASVAIISAVASAEPDRPKFYFPRQIKRPVFINSTITSHTPNPKETIQDTLTSRSTRRSVSDLFHGHSSDISGRTGSTSNSDAVTTIIIMETTLVGPDTTAPTSSPIDLSIGSTGSIPSVIVFPTTSSSSDVAASSASASDTTGTGITFGPGGVVSSSSAASSTDDTDSTSGSAPSSTAASAPSSTAGILPVISSVVSDLTSALLPTSTAVDSSAPSSTAGITGPGTSATISSAAPSSTVAATSDTPSSDLLSSIIASLLPTSTLGVTGPASTGVASTGGVVTPTPTDFPTSSTGAPDSTGLGSILSSILGTSTTAPGSAPTSTVIGSGPSGNSTDITGPTSTFSGSSTIITGTGPTTTPVSGDNTTSFIISATPSSSVAGSSQVILTTGSTTPVGISSSATTFSPTSTSGANGTAVVTGSSGAPSSTAVGITSVETSAAPTSTSPPSLILPTGTDAATSMWLPQTIIAASSASLAPGATPSAQPTGISSLLPKVITPPNGTVEQPDGTSLVQLGFMYQLNYPFVVNNPLSSAQIFQYLPEGVADGLGLRGDQVTMHSLIPLDTSQALGYVTTLALAYIPTTMVSTLGLDLHAPTASIYNNGDPSVNTLMNYINPAIPLTPGSTLAGSAVTGTGSGSQATSTSNSGNSGVFNTDAQNTTPSVKATTAGVAIGAVGAAAAYGAAMFFIARRYKKRKQMHRRSSSLINPSEMRQSGSPALLGGANAYMAGGRTTPGGATQDRNSRGSGRSNGNSARTQQISAPMMAENSLGWN